MAKQRQQNSILAAIGKVCDALEIESIPNPTDEQKQQIHDAKVEAASVIRGSNFMTLAEHADDNIETAHQVDAVFDAAGIDRVEFQRQAAIDGATATVEAVAALEDGPEPPAELTD